MCEYGFCSPWCCVIGILVAIAWWLFASGLLLCAWNSVIASIANVKKAKYWQALVIVLTLVVLCGPFVFGRYMRVAGRDRFEWRRHEKVGSYWGEMKKHRQQSPCDTMRYHHYMAPQTPE
jgi:hypothetical protein